MTDPKQIPASKMLAHCNICGKDVPGNMKGETYKHSCKPMIPASGQSLPERLRALARTEVSGRVIAAQPAQEINQIADEIERQQAEPDNDAWKQLIAYSYQMGGDGVRHIHSITSHYIAMRTERDRCKVELDLSHEGAMSLANRLNKVGAELEHLRGEFAFYKSEKADEILLLRSALDFEQKQHLESLDREQKLHGEREQDTARLDELARIIFSAPLQRVEIDADCNEGGLWEISIPDIWSVTNYQGKSLNEVIDDAVRDTGKKTNE